jgi:hypothetical protein
MVRKRYITYSALTMRAAMTVRWQASKRTRGEVAPNGLFVLDELQHDEFESSEDATSARVKLTSTAKAAWARMSADLSAIDRTLTT